MLNNGIWQLLRFAFLIFNFSLIFNFLEANTIILQESFAKPALPEGWVTIANEGNPWQVIFNPHYACSGEYTLVCRGDREKDSDSWLISDKFNLNSGTLYEISLSLRVRTSFHPEKIAIMLIGPDDQKREIYFDNAFNETQCYRLEREFFIDHDGLYRLAFHYHSNKGGRNIFIDDIQINKAPMVKVRPAFIAYYSDTENISFTLTNNGLKNVKLFLEYEGEGILIFPKGPINLKPEKTKQMTVNVQTPDKISWKIPGKIKITTEDGLFSDSIETVFFGNRWTDKSNISPLPYSDFAIGAVTDFEHIYTFSGFAGSNAARLDLTENKWELLAAPPSENPEPFSSVYFQGSFYFFDSTRNILYSYTYSECGGSYRHIPGPSEFKENEHFRRPSIVEFGGNIFAMGHTNNETPYIIQFWQYNIQKEKWTRLPCPARPRMLSGMTAKNGRIYIIGGVDSNYKDIANGEEFDIISGTWNKAPFPPVPGGAGYPGTLLNIGRYLLFDIGRTDNRIFVFKIHCPEWNEWTELHPKPLFNFYAGSVIAQGGLHMFGGTGNVPLSNQCIRDLYFIMEHDVLIADAGKGGVVRPDSTIRLGINTSAVGGTPPYNYYWSDNKGWQSELEKPLYIMGPDKKVRIELLVRDSSGQTDSDFAIFYNENSLKNYWTSIIISGQSK